MKLCGESRPKNKVIYNSEYVSLCICCWNICVTNKQYFPHSVLVICHYDLMCTLAESLAKNIWSLRLAGGPPLRWSCCMPAVEFCPVNPQPETSRPLCSPFQSVWTGLLICRVSLLVKPLTTNKLVPHLRCPPVAGQLACKYLQQHLFSEILNTNFVEKLIMVWWALKYLML